MDTAHKRLTFKHIPERDALAGPTVGDNVRHGIVRRAFLKCMVADERVQAMYAGWLEDSEIPRAKAALEIALARAEAEEASIDVTDEMVAYVEAQNAFLGRANEAIGRGVASDAIELVRSMELPWAWLPLELHREFVVGLWSDAMRLLRRCGVPDIGEVKREWEIVAPPAPAMGPVVLELSGRPGETTLERRDRILAEARQLADVVSAAPEIPQGTIPDKQTPILRRYASYFYRSRVRRESISAIARDVWPGEDRRGDVRYGVERAEHFLGMGVYVLKAPGENRI